MDRESAQRNIRAGFLAGGIGLFVFALAFYVSMIYLA